MEALLDLSSKSCSSCASLKNGLAITDCTYQYFHDKIDDTVIDFSNICN